MLSSCDADVEDFIGVFNQNGLCCGVVSYQNQNIVLTAFGDDPTTLRTDGMAKGETLCFRIFNPETGKDSTVELAFDEQMPQSETFVNHGMLAVKRLESTGVNEDENSGLNISIRVSCS